MLEAISADYEGEVTFLALGGNSELERLQEKADDWFPSGRIAWAYDKRLTVWQTLGVAGTPTTITFDSEGKVIAAWSGERGADFMRDQIEALIVSG